MIIPSRLSMMAAALKGDPSAWRAAHAHPWLVWEAGSWTRPGADEDVTREVIGRTAALRVDTKDALCYALPPPGKEYALTVGRHRLCSITLNDGSVSRHHLTLNGDHGTWRVRTEHKPVLFRGLLLAPASTAELVSGGVLELGGARLTFLSADDMAARLAAVGPSGA